MLAIAVVLGAAVALVCGGSLKNLAQWNIKSIMAPMIALFLKAASMSICSGMLPRVPYFPIALSISYLLNLFFLIANGRNRLFLLFGGSGTLLNYAVIAVNGFRMPISQTVLGAAGFQGVPESQRVLYAVADGNTKLSLLGDQIYLPGPVEGFASIGDVLLAIGVAALVFNLLKPSAKASN